MDFGGSRLNLAQMTNMKLFEVTFGGARMLGTNLEKSVLSKEAMLSGAEEYLFIADLSGVRYDSTTKWPEGFTPPTNAVQLGGN